LWNIFVPQSLHFSRLCEKKPNLSGLADASIRPG
jgi:hypothetical protein